MIGVVDPDGPGGVPALQIKLPDADEWSPTNRTTEQVKATIGMMFACVDDAMYDPRVEWIARVLGQRAIYNGSLMAKEVYRYALHCVRFKADPRGQEKLIVPGAMIEQMNRQLEAEGDCDDRAMLMVALLAQLGEKAGFAVMRRPGKPNWEHVFAYADINGQRLYLDPQENTPFGKPTPPLPDAGDLMHFPYTRRPLR